MGENTGAEETPKQIEFTEDTLKAAISGVMTGQFDKLLKDQRHEFKNTLEEALKEIKKPVDKKPIGGEEKDMGGDNSPKPYTSFGDQLKAVWGVENGQQRDVGLDAINKAATGLGSTIPADGGFLVQTDFNDTLLEDSIATGVIASRINNMPVSANSDSLKLNGVDETSRANGSRQGGVRGYWNDEAEAMTGSKPKFRQMELTLKGLTVLVYVTDKLLGDSTALEAFVNRAASNEFGFKMDDAYLTGDGAGKPMGIKDAPATVSVAKETSQTADTVVYENITNMWSRMSVGSMVRGVWHINQNVFPQLFSMALPIGTAGVPVYMPAGGISGSPYSTLFGRPVIPLEQCETLGDKGDIYFVDWDKYTGITKGGIKAASSIHVRFLNNETAFRFVMQLDGQPERSAALTPYKGGSSFTTSPYITLAERA